MANPVNHIYCFALYCEGNGQTKTEAFATIRLDEEAARKHAEEMNKRKYPVKDGWYNHQLSMLVVPKETVLSMAKEYEAALQE